MKTLQILRSWRRCSTVDDKATFAEVEAASAALEEVERHLGQGHTGMALDLAIENEVILAGERRRQRKPAVKKHVRGQE